MLSGNSSWRLHLAQNAALIILSLFFLPLDTVILFGSYLARLASSHGTARRRARRDPTFRPRTILVTGVGMNKGLTLARMFWESGHNVIGVDFEPYNILVCGRFSRALTKFYPTQSLEGAHSSAYYAQELLDIVKREKVDLWVSCSGVASAVQDGTAEEVIERRSDCRCIQFDVKTTSTLHEKHTFIEEAGRLGLPTPETHNVTSRTAVHNVLNRTEKKKYILKSVGMDDAYRGDMTLFPRRTMSETYHHIASLPISTQKPWVLQQYVRGKEYCTHALVIDGKVKAFVACPSLDMLMHYEVLPPDSALSKAMFKFTEAFASRSDGGITGHLSFDFLVEESATEKGTEVILRPIECNPRAHTAVVLFQGRGTEMVEAYMEALKPEINGITEPPEQAVVTPANNAPACYWVGHDLATLLVYPLFQLFTRQITFAAFLRSCLTLVEHLLFWKDGTFEIWDPLPWWWLYHVYWPGQFFRCILQRKKWGRVNVSTTKIFAC